MAKRKVPDGKNEALRRSGSLNPHPEKIRDELFTTVDFFDARDLVQVKYEMVRRVRVDGQHVNRSATAFGFSRPSFYKAQAAFAQGGLPALVPKKPGPRRAHKLSDEVVDFLERSLSDDTSLRPRDLARRIEERFGVSSHPRSIERALARREKKRR
jgi:transposase